MKDRIEGYSSSSGPAKDHMKRIVYLSACQPVPPDLQKLDTLSKLEDVEIHVAYWDRTGWSMRTPFSTELPAEQIHVLRRPNPSGGVLARMVSRARVIGWFARKLRELRPQVVHACSMDMLVAAWLARWVLPDLRIVFDLMDTPDWMWNRWTQVAQRLLYRSVAQVLVTSPRFETHFLRKFGLLRPGCPVLFVPNTPWKSLFAGIESPEPGDEMTIAVIGGLREEGPVRSLLEAVDRLRGEGFGVRLFYAGVGPCRPILDEAAQTRSYLSAHGAFEYHRDIVKLYRNVHFAFACYRRAPDRRIHLANRFADAMNCGVPVIVSSGTYMAELATRDHVGLVVEPEDPESLASALRPILRDPDRWRDLARNARRVRDAHTYDAYVPALLAAYRRLLDEGDASAHRPAPEGNVPS